MISITGAGRKRSLSPDAAAAAGDLRESSIDENTTMSNNDYNNNTNTNSKAKGVDRLPV
jgi:hypothetical protein